MKWQLFWYGAKKDEHWGCAGLTGETAEAWDWTLCSKRFVLSVVMISNFCVHCDQHVSWKALWRWRRHRSICYIEMGWNAHLFIYLSVTCSCLPKHKLSFVWKSLEDKQKRRQDRNKRIWVPDEERTSDACALKDTVSAEWCVIISYVLHVLL